MTSKMSVIILVCLMTFVTILTVSEARPLDYYCILPASTIQDLVNLNPLPPDYYTGLLPPNIHSRQQVVVTNDLELVVPSTPLVQSQVVVSSIQVVPVAAPPPPPQLVLPSPIVLPDPLWY